MKMAKDIKNMKTLGPEHNSIVRQNATKIDSPPLSAMSALNKVRIDKKVSFLGTTACKDGRKGSCSLKRNLGRPSLQRKVGCMTVTSLKTGKYPRQRVESKPR